MAVFDSNVFVGSTQDLDGHTFKNTQFKNCKLVYAGGLPPSFEGCEFIDSQFVFDGAAGNTLMFLQAMASPKSGVQQVIRAIFPHLSQG